MQTVVINVFRDVGTIGQFFTFRTRLTHEQVPISEKGAIISEKTAKTLGVTVGDFVQFQDGSSEKMNVQITGIFENYIGHYIFLTADTYEEIFSLQPTYNIILLKYSNTSDIYEDELGRSVLENSCVQGISFVSTTKEWANDTLSSLNTIVIIVLSAAALLAFVVLYNLNTINIAEKTRELATLKVLGFYDNEVAAYVFRENILLKLIGIVFGIAVGIFLHQYVIQSIEVDLIMFGRSIAWISYIIGAALTLCFSVIVNTIMYGSIKRINMIESLKSIE